MTASVPEPAAVTSTAAGSGATSTDLALARVEGKIDVVLTRHETKIDAHGVDIADHEDRLRVLEAKPTVSPRALWTTVVSAIAAAGGLLALFDRFAA